MRINNDTIIKDDNPLIRQKSLPVSIPLSADDEALAHDMMQYVKDSINPELAEKYNLRPAVGISAIQVGVPKQITAIYIVEEVDEEDNPTKVTELLLANPKITSRSVQQSYLTNGEGCLSVVTEHPGHIYRNARVTIEGYDVYTKKQITYRARGFNAICIQHELDHFDGVLFYDHIDPNDPNKEDPNAIAI